MAKKKSDGFSFADERAKLEASLETARAELTELEERWRQHGVQTREARATLAKLRSVLDGKLPAEGKGKRRGKPRGKIQSLEVNADTGRPARGSRREQIEMICTQLGKGGEAFRSVEVLNELRAIEDDVSSGMKSYTYTVLNTLGEEGVLSKVGRGKWTLG